MESLFSLPSPCLFPTPSPSAPKTLNPTTLSSPLSLHHHHLRRHRNPTRTATAILRSHGLSSAPSTALSDASDPFDIGVGQGDDAKFDWYAQWYPVAPLCDLDERAPHAKTVMGLDVVVWWDRAEGRWQVFDDRCPHRLAPLSEGRIDPRGRLQCVYHGWCFDGSGNCKYIPQAPSSGPQVHLNTKACAAVYPSVEQNKVLWFWPSTDPQYKDILEKKRPPYIEELDDPSYTCSMGIRELQYGYEVLVENLMDPAHVPYAHHGLMRVRRRVEPGRAEADREGGGPVEITIEESNKSGFLAKQDAGYFRFIAPCLFYGAATVNQSATSRNVQENISAQPQQRLKRFLLIFMCIQSVLEEAESLSSPCRGAQDRESWLFQLVQSLLRANKRAASTNSSREQLMDRYWSHVVQCNSCRGGLKFLKALEFSLQVLSLALIGTVAAARHSLTSATARNSVVFAAVLCFAASRLTHFQPSLLHPHIPCSKLSSSPLPSPSIIIIIIHYAISHLPPFSPPLPHSLSFPTQNPKPKPSPPLSLHHHLRRHRSPARTATTVLRSHGLSSAPSPALSDASDPFDIGDGQGDDAKFDWYAQWYPVFDDRCPHRLAPLSEGRIDPRRRLQCVYHGWCFDGSGNCKYIPQALSSGPQVHLNSKACAAVYPSVVQNKVLWFWPSTDPQYKDILEMKRPPYIEELDDPSYTCSMGIRELQYGYEVLIENLMDPAHVPYAHRGIMRTRRPEADREGGGPIDITITESSKSGFLANLEFGYFKFAAPCLFYGAGTISRSASSRNVQEQLSCANSEYFSSTPAEAQEVSSHIHVYSSQSWKKPTDFCTSKEFAVWIELFFRRWMRHVGQNLILDSDHYLLHVEERKIAKVGFSNWFKACYVPTNEQLPPTPPREQLMDRYWSHVVQCSSCRGALKVLKALEFSLQVLSLALIGIVAAARHSLTSATTRNSVVSAAVLCFVASRWLSHFIYKTFYFHDYNHAFK
uniref:Rieske domain-containing protein n=1 Tax=Ananas comosus var. bracteatus TaxID=296719 RepID=A0A6V7QBF7_ANACO|nr:unnamed protein product [Ananas comosus var. bracteatus]